MRKQYVLLLLLGLLLCLPRVATGQYAAVSATVQDPAGIPYAYGSGTVSLVMPSGALQQPLFGGSTFQTVHSITKLSSTGTFSLSLPRNDYITPASTQWRFNLCDSSGKYCFSTNLTIAAASPDITANLRAAAAAIVGMYVLPSGQVDLQAATGQKVATFGDGLAALGSVVSVALATPINGTFVDIPTGGSLNASTAYYYRVSAINSYGETLPSTETSLTTGGGGNTHQITVTWAAIVGATGYRVYGRSTGAEQLLQTVSGGSTLSWTDSGSGSPSGALPLVESTARAAPLRYALPADVSATSTTLVTFATFAVAASKTYCVHCELYVSSSSTSNTPRVQATCPASPTYSLFGAQLPTSATAFAANTAACGSLISGAATVTITTVFPGRLSGTLVNGTTAGSLALQVGSSGSYTTTVKQGSFCALY